MGITIGDAILWIRGKSDKLPGDLGAAEKQVQGWSGKINAALKGAIGVGVTAAISSGIRKITDNMVELGKESLKTGLEYGRQVAQMKRITGLSADESSRLIQIADDMELSYEGLSTAIRMYSVEQGKAGINTKVGIDQLAALSDEYIKLAPGTERNAFLIDKFGRSGLQMAHLMEQGGNKIREMSNAVEDSLILTEEAIENQERYRLSVDSLGDAMDGLKVKLSGALSPLQTEWNMFLVKVVIPVLERLIDKFLQLPRPMQAAIVGLVLLAGAGAKAAPALVGIASMVNLLVGSGGFAGVTAAIGGLIPALTGIGATILGVVLSPIGLLMAAIALLIVTIVTLGPQAWKSLTMLWQMFIAVIKRLATDIKAWSKTIGTNFVYGIGEGIKTAWEWLKTTVAELAQTLLQAAKDALEMESPGKAPAREIGKPFAQGIGMGFEQAIPELIAQIQLALKPVPAMAMGGMGNMSVGHIEYHGAFSRDEMNRLDRRSKRIASDTLEELLK